MLQVIKDNYTFYYLKIIQMCIYKPVDINIFKKFPSLSFEILYFLACKIAC